MRQVYAYALKLLAGRDYSTHRLRLKLEKRFEDVPDDVIERLTENRFLNDRRFAENFVRRRKHWGHWRLEAELARQGISAAVAREVLEREDWPSTEEAVKARMDRLNLGTPLSKKDAARLFRSVRRLGYDAEEIIEELKRYS